MIDCGLFQGFKQLRLRNWAPIAVTPDKVVAIVLTHAHLDHSGYLPLLVKEGFEGTVYASAATRDLCKILLPDSGHIQEEDAEFANRHGFSKHAPAMPLYTRQDALDCLPHIKAVALHHAFSPAPGWKVTLQSAGHILGACSVLVEVAGRRLLFSGDLGRPDDTLMNPPEDAPQADIEIENCLRADVYDNEAYGNTGGILVFSMPDLPVIQNGAGTRIFRNKVHDNNTDNFAPKGNIVGMVPAGTGIMILANRDVEIFNNTIENNQTASVIVTSFYASERPIKDPNYEAQARNTYIHDNVMRNSGSKPSGMLAEIKDGAGWAGVKLEPMPQVLHDGIKAGKIKDIAELKLCIKNNTIENPSVAFANLDLENAGLWKALFRIWKPRAYATVPADQDCTLPALPAVTAVKGS
jgi:glyoxylase-like metal-dependent hydrolase (beta-lactamase superfamily II)